MDIEAFRIALASEQQVVVSVRVRMDKELLGIWSGLEKGLLTWTWSGFLPEMGGRAFRRDEM